MCGAESGVDDFAGKRVDGLHGSNSSYSVSAFHHGAKRTKKSSPCHEDRGSDGMHYDSLGID